jgi:hypothetical protein
MSKDAPHPRDAQKPGPDTENLRNSGERKLEARPDGGNRQAGDFLADNDREAAANTHLLEDVDVVYEKTRQSEGENPPGTFLAEGEKPSEDPDDRPDMAGLSDRRQSREL